MTAISALPADASSILCVPLDEAAPTLVEDSWLAGSEQARCRQGDSEIQNYLMELDGLRRECEWRGQFRIAQACLDRICEVNRRCAKKTEIEARKTNLEWKRQMMEEHRLELFTFHDMWERKMMDYDEKAEKLRRELSHQHAMDMHSEEKAFRLELKGRRLRPSKKLVDLREHLQALLQQQMYTDADRLRRAIHHCEREELRAFGADLEKTLQRHLQTAAERRRVARAAVEQRLMAGREELTARRRHDFDALTRRHRAALRASGDAHRRVGPFVDNSAGTGPGMSRPSRRDFRPAWRI